MLKFQHSKSHVLVCEKKKKIKRKENTTKGKHKLYAKNTVCKENIIFIDFGSVDTQYTLSIIHYPLSTLCGIYVLYVKLGHLCGDHGPGLMTP